MKKDFNFLINAFLQERRERNFSIRTIKGNGKNLRLFQNWCSKQGIILPGDVNRKHITAYCGYLLLYRTKDGKLLRESTRRHYICSVTIFYRWLFRNNIVISDPTDHITLKRSNHGPGDLLTETEIEAIMAQPDLRRVTGLRNRTILETFYATGIRCSELVTLRTRDLSLQMQTMFVRQGKGKKDRVVPIGVRCSSWLERYLQSAHPYLIKVYDPGYLFLTRWSGPFKPDSVGDIVREYIRQCGITKRGACHLFRRAMATGMLENGADIRYVQAILGHNSPRTTQQYTLLSKSSLKKVHHRTHPFEQ